MNKHRRFKLVTAFAIGILGTVLCYKIYMFIMYSGWFGLRPNPVLAFIPACVVSYCLCDFIDVRLSRWLVKRVL
jgi:hypothetical protein